ncbi:hypothetical protein FH972_025092 [Carpinus fangiana]|uniref:DNA repair and recombination protein RAD54B n=1 Tax=Carpinus fangiana TaxID=176857 RepID=A0A5N6L2J6_9ROSI|nr:hypothetical protein FH972_025092 [Carpinus fangiana]
MALGPGAAKLRPSSTARTRRWSDPDLSRSSLRFFGLSPHHNPPGLTDARRAAAHFRNDSSRQRGTAFRQQLQPTMERPPLLKKPAPVERVESTPPPPDSDIGPPAKKRRLSDDPDEEADDEKDDALDSFLDEAEGLAKPFAASAKAFTRPPRPKLSSSAFRKAHAASRPSEYDNTSVVKPIPQPVPPTPAAVPSSALEGYFNALWRKITNKKNKTWDGDGVLVVRDGYARLQDLSGRDMGRVKCDSLPVPGATLTMSGKEVEVDSEIPKAEYLAGKQHLGSTPAKATIKELEEQMRTDVRFNAPQVAPQSSSVMPIPNPASQQRPTNTAFKNPMLNTSSGLGPVPREPAPKPVPRHDPEKDGALVMKKLKNAPIGKQVVDVVVDPIVSAHFREHQREGVKFMYECVMGMRSTGEGCILADEMGLGKTLQVIALIWTLLKQNPVYGDVPVVKKALIVCPATLIKNWRKEFRKWLGNERIGVFVVEDKARIRDFTHGKAYNVCIIGYEKLVKEQEQFQKGPGIDIVVADEGHRLKSATNKAAQAIKALGTERRIVLSGTPLQNNLSEFYFTTDLVNPGILGKPGVFKRQFETPIVKARQQDASPKDIELGEARYKELADLTGQFLLRRTADILAQYLPPKTEYVLFCKPTAVQASVYRSILSSTTFSALLKAPNETTLQMINVLKKVCNSPNLLRQREDAEEKDSAIRNMLSNIPQKLLTSAGASGKLQVLDRLLHSIRYGTTEKVVLVSHYTATLDVLGNLLNSLDYSWLRLDGTTVQGKRQGLVDKFNRTSQQDCFVFLLSAKSGGAGLNLIGASRLILFDVDWNPSTDAQAMARIHRDGQTKPCRIYRLMTRGALDEKIYQRQITKQGLADSVVDSKQDGGSTFSREELQQLFRLDEDEHCQTHELLGCECEGRGQLPSTGLVEGTLLVVESTASSPSSSDVSSSSASEDEEDGEPSFKKSSRVEPDPKEREDIAAAKRKRSTSKPKKEGGTFASLMHYRHIDTALFTKSETEGNGPRIQTVIDDEVLHKVLGDAENRISYIFAKTAGGSKTVNMSDEE